VIFSHHCCGETSFLFNISVEIEIWGGRPLLVSSVWKNKYASLHLILPDAAIDAVTVFSLAHRESIKSHRSIWLQ